MGVQVCFGFHEVARFVPLSQMEDDEFDWGEADDTEELVDYDYDDWDSTYLSNELSVQPWSARFGHCYFDSLVSLF